MRGAIVLIGLAASSLAAPLAGRASSCTYTCPSANLVGGKLLSSLLSVTNVLQCTYVAGLSTAVCTYSSTTGSRTGALGNCPASAISSCTTTPPASSSSSVSTSASSSSSLASSSSAITSTSSTATTTAASSTRTSTTSSSTTTTSSSTSTSTTSLASTSSPASISLPISVPTSVPISIPTSLPVTVPTSLPITLPTTSGTTTSTLTSDPLTSTSQTPTSIATSSSPTSSSSDSSSLSLPVTLPTSLSITLTPTSSSSSASTTDSSTESTASSSSSSSLSLPISIPTSLPISIPTSLPIALPTSSDTSSISLPISVPTSLPVTVPTSLPITLPTSTSTSSSSAPSSTLPGGWTLAYGCAVDTASRVLASPEYYQLANNTPAVCTAKCTARGYTIAAVEYGYECFCAQGYTSVLPPQSAPASECNKPCSGDAGQTCGGGYRLQIYEVPAAFTDVAALPAGWVQTMPCGVDTQDRIFADTQMLTLANNTPARCIQQCSALGFPMAGVEYGNECYCGSSYRNGTPPPVAPPTQCQFACAGAPGLTCGGSWGIQVYATL